MSAASGRVRIEELRRFLVAYQGLDRRQDPSGIVDGFVRRVGCIQYDPLNIIGRNPDLVLQARFTGYRRGMLESLLYEQRRLVDGWDKMMSIYPVEDWPAFTRLRAHRKRELRASLRGGKASPASSGVEAVLRHLGEKGAARGGHIELGELERGGWGPARQSSLVLDYLFHVGRVGVRAKVNSQKLYDLIEKLLPESLLEAKDPFESERDFHAWLLLRRIGSVGALWNRQSALWLGLGEKLKKREYRQGLIARAVKRGELAQLGVEGLDEPCYLKAADLPLLESARRAEPGRELRFLAPLDNLLWDRDLVEALFGFAYRWEVYTPAAKRSYGYYVLPILRGPELIGRIEPVLEEGKRRLVVKKLWLEPSVKLTKSLRSAIGEELRTFADYLEVPEVEEY